MSTAENKAVFLSYASQDVEAVKRICEALREAGVEVWFDQSELRGGDAWDAKIRKQIKECALFVPIISANTQARREGYFRLEWRLAAQRTHMMSEQVAFLLPIVIDATRDAEADVPTEFKTVQWTRLGTSEAVDAFAGRVRHLLEGTSEVSAQITAKTSEAPRGSPRRPHLRWVGVAVALGAMGFGWWKWGPARSASPRAVASSEASSLARRATDIVEDEEHYGRAALELAEQFCQQAIARAPNDVEAHAAYARVHAAFIFTSLDPTTERRAAAQREMSLAARLAPDTDEVLLARADFFKLSSATRAESEPLLRTMAARRPQHKYTLRLLARTLRAQALALGDQSAATAPLFDEAVALLRRADALPGGDPMALLLLAQHETALGRGDEAERVLDEGLARQLSPRLLRYKSDLRVARGDLSGASATVEKLPASSAIEPGFTAARVQIRVWQRRPEEALRLLAACPVDYFEDLFFTGPKDYWTGLALSLQPNRQDAARLAWQQALRLVENRLAKQPGVAHLVRWKGVLLSHVGDPVEARRQLELAEQLEDSSSRGLNNARLAASAWLRLGEHARALELIRGWRTVSPSSLGWLRFDPEFDALRDSPEFQGLLGEIAQRTGFVLTAASNTGRVDAPADAKSVAVLAFRQLSADPENEYLCEAISDELCSVLGRVPGLKVAASASAFQFKGNPKPPVEMARQLGVAYLLVGTVQKIGTRVRVRAELLKAGEDFPVWSSNSLEHDSKDMFAVQDEVVASIARNLQLQLGAGGVTAARSIHPEAFRLYFEGRRAWSGRGGAKEVIYTARRLFQEAIALDAQLGRAYAGLADVALLTRDLALTRFGNRNSAQWREVLALSEQAIAHEPESAETHATHGRALLEGWRIAEAERALRTAIRLNPSCADAHALLGRVLLNDGRMEEALTHHRLAMELDPLTAVNFVTYGRALSRAGRHADALVQVDRGLALLPDFGMGLHVR